MRTSHDSDQSSDAAVAGRQAKHLLATGDVSRETISRRAFVTAGITALTSVHTCGIVENRRGLQSAELYRFRTDHGSLLIARKSRTELLQRAGGLLNFFEQMYGLKEVSMEEGKITVELDDPLGKLRDKIEISSYPDVSFSRTHDLFRVIAGVYIALHCNGDGMGPAMVQEYKRGIPTITNKGSSAEALLRTSKAIVRLWSLKAGVGVRPSDRESEIQRYSRSLNNGFKSKVEWMDRFSDQVYKRSLVKRIAANLRVLTEKPRAFMNIPSNFRLTANTQDALQQELDKVIASYFVPELEGRLFSYYFGYEKDGRGRELAQTISYSQWSDEGYRERSRLAAAHKAFTFMFGEEALPEASLFIPHTNNAVPEFHFKFPDNPNKIAVPLNVAYSVSREEINSEIPDIENYRFGIGRTLNLDKRTNPDYTIAEASFRAFCIAVASNAQLAREGGLDRPSDSSKLQEQAREYGIQYYQGEITRPGRSFAPLEQEQ